MKQPTATNIEEAIINLDGERTLDPIKDKDEYEQYYIKRPKIESKLLIEAKRAASSSNQRPFTWFFTGHTGSGKSTEINRILTDEGLIQKYLAIHIDLETDFNLYDIDYTDLILAIGRGCAQKAEDSNCKISPELNKALRYWGADIIAEEEKHTETEGSAGVKVGLWRFFAFQEEIKSGGAKRETIRRKISGDIVEFTKLLDELAGDLYKHTGLKPLVVLDGLDHKQADECYDVLYPHYDAIVESNISKIIVIPLPLLYKKTFSSKIDRIYSTVPNIKVFAHEGTETLDENGFQFFRDVISRYITLDFFSEEALQSLFLLSAGIVRDMIRNTADACMYASDAGEKRVDNAHVEYVWNDVMRLYRSRLYAEDYETLNYVAQHPRPQQMNGIPSLLFTKEIVYYPNCEGWYGIHPAVQRILKTGE